MPSLHIKIFSNHKGDFVKVVSSTNDLKFLTGLIIPLSFLIRLLPEMVSKVYSDNTSPLCLDTFDTTSPLSGCIERHF